MTAPIFGPMASAAFERRGINPETAARYGVFTGVAETEFGTVTPDAKGNVIVFPYTDGGKVVNAKYRGKDKKFWQQKGGKKTFYNADVMDDPALSEGRAALVITEGELDALSAIDSGYPFVVSVPDGAPPVPKDKSPDDLEPIDPSTDSHGKWEYLWNNRERLKRIKRFILATDNDPPGQRLAAELRRRLNAARCSYVTYPEGCKDLNDVTMKHGAPAVSQLIARATPYPVRGLYRLDDYPPTEQIETFATGLGLGHALHVFLGEFMVVTGIPNHGKSAWVMNLVASLVSTHGWTAAVCSPEMPAVPQMRDRLRRWWVKGAFAKATPAERQRADEFINRRFVFLDVDPTGTGEGDEPFDLQWVIDRATEAVLRDGIRILVIDPWNEIEHARDKGESMTDYIARSIRTLKRFARLYSVIVIVVAHPTKDVGLKDSGKTRLPSLYDIEGSAAWYNKADHGIVIERHEAGTTTLHLKKVRFEDTGTRGTYELSFDAAAWRFSSVDG